MEGNKKIIWTRMTIRMLVFFIRHFEHFILFSFVSFTIIIALIIAIDRNVFNRGVHHPVVYSIFNRLYLENRASDWKMVKDFSIHFFINVIYSAFVVTTTCGWRFNLLSIMPLVANVRLYAIQATLKNSSVPSLLTIFTLVLECKWWKASPSIVHLCMDNRLPKFSLKF